MEFSGDGHGGDGYGGAGHHGVPSFHDVFLGIELAATLTGHGVSLADATAASLFAEALLDHGGGYEFSFPTGYAQDVPALQGSGPPDGPTAFDDRGRELSLPGIAQKANTIEVLYWPHGRCEPRQATPSLAERAGLERYRPIYHPTWDEIVRNEPRILSGVPIGTAEERDRLPNGWYQGVRGTTEFWRQFFRARRSRAPFSNTPESYEDHRTLLIVSGVTWHYHHTEPYWLNDDYETRVALTVYSQPVGIAGGGWAYKRTQLRQHWQAAQRLARALHDYLAAYPPSLRSLQFRRSMDPGRTRPGGRQAEPGAVPTATIRESVAAPGAQAGQRGVCVSVGFDILGAAGQPCWVSAAFFRADGSPLRDADGRYRNRAGCVSVAHGVTPATPTLRDCHSLFIPEAQLHLPAGEYRLICAVAIWKDAPDGNWTWLAGKGGVQLDIRIGV